MMRTMAMTALILCLVASAAPAQPTVQPVVGEPVAAPAPDAGAVGPVGGPLAPVIPNGGATLVVPENGVVEPEVVPVEEPPAPLTAAERFMALPRFGDQVFRMAEEPVAATEPPTRPNEPPTHQTVADESSPSMGEAVPPSYIVGPGDQLAVRVWTDAIEHVNASPVVTAEGSIYLDLLGEVTVAGQRIADVREQITSRYRKFFTRAEVSVGLARSRVIEVRVTGDALRPGKYRLAGAPTLFSALYAAGGPSDIGSLRAIKLMRAGAQPLLIDLYGYLLEGDPSADVPLEADDTIFIGAAREMAGVAGEVRRPARYELGELTTLGELVEMAGGSAATAYKQGVEVWRVTVSGRRQMLAADLNGAGPKGAGMLLQDGDLVVVPPALETAVNTVTLTGAVERPGCYEVVEGMTLRDLIEAAQGLTSDAHTENAAVRRLDGDMDYRMLSVDLRAALRGDATANIALRPRDEVTVYAESAVEPLTEVTIEGTVRRPGVYAWVAGMRVSDLILQAGDLTDQAYGERAHLTRVDARNRRELISVDLGAARARDEIADIALQRGDVLRVFGRDEAVWGNQIRVEGFVRTPGDYPRRELMRASDAILVAGGLSPRAGEEIQYTQGQIMGEVQPIYLQLQRDGDYFTVEPDPILGDNDVVSVLGVGDLVALPPRVTIKGRVARPGTYVLEEAADRQDTLYNVLMRAGGALPDANPDGAVLYRLREAIIKDEQADDLRQVIATFNRELSADTIEGETARQQGIAASVTTGLQAALSQGGSVAVLEPRRLSADAWARAVPIEGSKIIASHGREGDCPLMDGDVIVVPRMPRTVTVMGAVVRPGALPFRAERKVRDYIAAAGGATMDAKPMRVVVIHANGSVSASAYLQDVAPGDIVLVPSDYIFRRLDKPGTIERLVTGIGAVLTGYLIAR